MEGRRKSVRLTNQRLNVAALGGDVILSTCSKKESSSSEREVKTVKLGTDRKGGSRSLLRTPIKND